jgi:hypothetical protein
MRLTRKKAIEFFKIHWTWLAKTGKKKTDYKYPAEQLKYIAGERPKDDCWFCEYIKQNKKNCRMCPVFEIFSDTCSFTIYWDWSIAYTIENRKKYAKLFLGQFIATFRRKAAKE